MSVTKDLHNLISVTTAIALTAVADGEDVAGVSIDRQGSDGFRNHLYRLVHTDGSVTPLVQESDDDSIHRRCRYADLTNTEASAALSAAGVSSIGYIGDKRYKVTAVTAAGSHQRRRNGRVKYGFTFTRCC